MLRQIRSNLIIYARKFIRLLLPGFIRRPIADRIYQLITLERLFISHVKIQLTRVQIKSNLIIYARKFIRLLLPSFIRRPVADRIYQLIALERFFISHAKIQLTRALFVLRRFDFSHKQKNKSRRNMKELMKLLYLGMQFMVAVYALSRVRYSRECLARTNSCSRIQHWRHKSLEAVTSRILELLDRYYRNCFVSFEMAFCSYQNRFKEIDFKGIMIINSSLGAGGTERQVVLTLKGLKQRGYGSLKLISFFLSTAEQQFYLPKIMSLGILSEELDRNLKHYSSLLDKDPIFDVIQKLPQELVVDVVDCMHALLMHRPAIVHLWLDDSNIKGGIAAAIIGVPRILLSTRSLPPFHYQFYQPYMREAYCWLLRQPNVVMLNNSEAGARAYEQWLRLPRGTIPVVCNGFDFDDTVLDAYCRNRLSYRLRCGIPVDAPLVGTVMRLQEEKRPLLWAEVAAYVRQKIPNAHFLIVGDGPLRDALELRGKLADLAGVFHVVGREEEVFAAIATMDLFLLTSRGEGLPNVLIEAQALGVPVVTTDVGGARETLEHGRTGWVLASDRVQAIGNKVVELLGDHTWRKEASTASPKFVKYHFGLDRMIEETLAFYNR